MRRLLAILLVAPLAGCAMPWVDAEPTGPTALPGGTTPPVPAGPPLAFGGLVLDARSGEPVAGADVRLDLGQVRPCRREGIVWNQWEAAAGPDGRFGPITVPRPRSDDVAFFLYVGSPRHSPESRFVGPKEASGDLGNLTFTLHETATVQGLAPPGTVLAMEATPFPRLTAADAEGRWTFDEARATPTQLVAATDPPSLATVAGNATLAFPDGNATGWVLEGLLRRESGAPLAADIVAWNGTRLVGAARAAENGVFVLPLPPASMEVRIEARTLDGTLGGTKVLALQGPPATRETLLVRALC